MTPPRLSPALATAAVGALALAPVLSVSGSATADPAPDNMNTFTMTGSKNTVTAVNDVIRMRIVMDRQGATSWTTFQVKQIVPSGLFTLANVTVVSPDGPGDSVDVQRLSGNVYVGPRYDGASTIAIEYDLIYTGGIPTDGTSDVYGLAACGWEGTSPPSIENAPYPDPYGVPAVEMAPASYGGATNCEPFAVTVTGLTPQATAIATPSATATAVPTQTPAPETTATPAAEPSQTETATVTPSPTEPPAAAPAGPDALADTGAGSALGFGLLGGAVVAAAGAGLIARRRNA